MDTYLIKDYMRSDVHCVHPDSTLKEAVDMMLRKKTNGLVVVDDSDHVVGILSSWDIIQYLVPDYLEEDKHLAAFESGDVFEKQIKHLQHDPIHKCMTHEVKTVKEDQTLMQAITLLSEFHIRQLPVVDDGNTLIGYLNRTDIKRVVGEVLGLHE